MSIITTTIVIITSIITLQLLSWKVSLFLVSFTPLFFILTFKLFLDYRLKNDETHGNPLKIFIELARQYWQHSVNSEFWLIVLCLAIVPIIVFFTKLVITIWFKSQIVYETIKEPQLIGDGLVSYVMTYIVPLTSLSYSASISEYVSNILLFLLIMIIYVRMDLVYLNPILILLCFNIFKASSNGQEKYILTRDTFSEFTSKVKNSETELIKLSNSLYFLKK